MDGHSPPHHVSRVPSLPRQIDASEGQGVVRRPSEGCPLEVRKRIIIIVVITITITVTITTTTTILILLLITIKRSNGDNEAAPALKGAETRRGPSGGVGRRCWRRARRDPPRFTGFQTGSGQCCWCCFYVYKSATDTIHFAIIVFNVHIL